MAGPLARTFKHDLITILLLAGSQGWMASFDDVPMETTGPSGLMPRDGGSGLWHKAAEGANSTGTSWAVFPDVESATRRFANFDAAVWV